MSIRQINEIGLFDKTFAEKKIIYQYVYLNKHQRLLSKDDY